VTTYFSNFIFIFEGPNLYQLTTFAKEEEEEEEACNDITNTSSPYPQWSVDNKTSLLLLFLF
jgi:hypothetical protein